MNIDQLKKSDWAFDAFHDFQGSRTAGLSNILSILKLPIYTHPTEGSKQGLNDIKDSIARTYGQSKAAEDGDRQLVEKQQNYELSNGPLLQSFRNIHELETEFQSKSNIQFSVPVEILDNDDGTIFQAICDYSVGRPRRKAEYMATWDVVPPVNGINKVCSGNVIFDSMTALNRASEYVKAGRIPGGKSIYGDYTLLNGPSINSSHAIELMMDKKRIHINYGNLTSSPSLLNIACLMDYLYQTMDNVAGIVPNLLGDMEAIYSRRSLVKGDTIPKISKKVVNEYESKIKALKRILVELADQAPARAAGRASSRIQYLGEREREDKIKKRDAANKELLRLETELQTYVNRTATFASGAPIMGAIGKAIAGAGVAGVAGIVAAPVATQAVAVTAAAATQVVVAAAAANPGTTFVALGAAALYRHFTSNKEVDDTNDGIIVDAEEDYEEAVDALDQATKVEALRTGATTRSRARQLQQLAETSMVTKPELEKRRKKSQSILKEDLQAIHDSCKKGVVCSRLNAYAETVEGVLNNAAGGGRKQHGGAATDSFVEEVGWLITLINDHALTYAEAFKLLLFIKGVGDDSYSGINLALGCDAHFTGDVIGAVCAFKHGVPVVVLKHKVQAKLCYTIYVQKPLVRRGGGMENVGSKIVSAKLSSMSRIAPKIASFLHIDILFDRFQDLAEDPTKKYYNLCIVLLKTLVLNSFYNFQRISGAIKPKNYSIQNPEAERIDNEGKQVLDTVFLEIYSNEEDILNLIDLRVFNEDGLLLDNSYFRLPLQKLFFELQCTLQSFDTSDPELGLLQYYLDEFLINNLYEQNANIRTFASSLIKGNQVDTQILATLNADLNKIANNLDHTSIHSNLHFIFENPAFNAALSTIQELVEEPDIPQKFLSNDPIQIQNYSQKAFNMDENPMPISFGGKTLKTRAKKSRKFTERKNKRKNKKI